MTYRPKEVQRERNRVANAAMRELREQAQIDRERHGRVLFHGQAFWWAGKATLRRLARRGKIQMRDGIEGAEFRL